MRVILLCSCHPAIVIIIVVVVRQCSSSFSDMILDISDHWLTVSDLISVCMPKGLWPPAEAAAEQLAAAQSAQPPSLARLCSASLRPKAGLATDYTSITWTQTGVQQLFYVTETGHGSLHTRGKENMWRWRRRNGGKARGHGSVCSSTNYSYKLTEGLVYVDNSWSWRDPFQKLFRLHAQTRAIANNSCHLYTSKSGQKL